MTQVKNAVATVEIIHANFGSEFLADPIAAILLPVLDFLYGAHALYVSPLPKLFEIPFPALVVHHFAAVHFAGTRSETGTTLLDIYVRLDIILSRSN